METGVLSYLALSLVATVVAFTWLIPDEVDAPPEIMLIVYVLSVVFGVALTAIVAGMCVRAHNEVAAVPEYYDYFRLGRLERRLDAVAAAETPEARDRARRWLAWEVRLWWWKPFATVVVELNDRASD